MQDSLPLDSLLNSYRQGKLNRKELEGRVFSHILNNFQRFNLRGWKQDEYADYLYWLYPRLGHAIDKYSPAGASFDAYIGAIIRWSAKEYRVIEKEHRLIEESCWDLRAAEAAAELHSREAEYLESGGFLGPPEPFKRVSNPRQALILLLKSYNYVSDDFITRAAPALGVPKEKLLLMVDELRRRRVERDEAVRRLRERVYSQYYRCMAFERRMEAYAPSSARYIRLKERLEKARKRLASMRERFSRIRAEATNRQVAETLGISKGAVDSSLFAVKRRFPDEDKVFSN